MIGTGIRLSLALLAVNVAACGGGAPEEVPEGRWDLSGAATYRPLEEEEWIAECRGVGAFGGLDFVSECTDDPVVAQTWAERGKSHWGDDALCDSRTTRACIVLDENARTLPADQ